MLSASRFLISVARELDEAWLPVLSRPFGDTLLYNLATQRGAIPV